MSLAFTRTGASAFTIGTFVTRNHGNVRNRDDVNDYISEGFRVRRPSARQRSIKRVPNKPVKDWIWFGALAFPTVEDSEAPVTHEIDFYQLSFSLPPSGAALREETYGTDSFPMCYL